MSKYHALVSMARTLLSFQETTLGATQGDLIDWAVEDIAKLLYGNDDVLRDDVLRDDGDVVTLSEKHDAITRATIELGMEKLNFSA